MAGKGIPATVTAALGKDEEILWSGKAAPFPLMNSENKTSILIRWIICAVFVIGLVGGYFASAANTGVQIKPVVVLIVVFIGAYLALIPVLDRNAILGKRLYFITNRRVMVTEGNRGVWTLDKAGLKTKTPPGESGTHFLFGTATELSAKKARVSAVVPVKEDNGPGITGLVFYNVSDAQGVRQAL